MISLCELDWVLCPNTTLRYTFADINWIHHECTVQVRRKLGRAQAIIGLESPGIRYTWCIENTVTVNSFATPEASGFTGFHEATFYRPLAGVTSVLSGELTDPKRLLLSVGSSSTQVGMNSVANPET